MSVKADLIIIDGMNLVYRYLQTLYLYDSKDNNTGVLYGFINTLCKLKKQFNGSIIVCWESSKSFRKEIYSDYKKNRSNKLRKTDSTKAIKKALKFTSVKQISAIGYEADDIAGHILLKNKNKKIVFVSTDKDWIQFITDKKKFLYNKKLLSKKDIEDKLSYSTQKIILYKTLVGDSDNIKGIHRIRKEYVLKILKNVNSFEEIFEFCKGEKNKWSEKIIANRKKLELNFELITAVRNLENITIIKNKKNYKNLFTFLKSYDIVTLNNRIEEVQL